jgi:hypothetical protein
VSLPSWWEIRDRLETHRRRLVAAVAIAATLGLAGGAWAWWSSRWKPPPSIFDTPVDDVLGYLAIDDFNQLPLEERVRFMIEFANRFRGVEQSESAVMAAFFAGLTVKSKEQLRQNARTLAKDILADGAATYVNLPDKERGAFIDQWLVRWSKVGEEIAMGEPRQRSDEDRIDEFRREARRGQERQAERAVDISLTEVGAARFLDLWQSDVEAAATPREQGQITRFMVDVRKRLTGGL